jgi:hypothetical protein
MQVQIDASLFTEGGDALGRISGALELEVAPRKGELISFLFSDALRSGPPVAVAPVQARVADVLHIPGKGGGILLLLEPLTVGSIGAGTQLAEYLTGGFNLFYEPYGDGAL